MYHTSICEIMQKDRDFNEWRAEKLGYVYFSRLNDLIIKEKDSTDPFFDYLIDISDDQKQTGRLFGVEVKAVNGTPVNIKSVAEQYKNIAFPFILVTFDNQTDHGYFKWIKEPKQDGRLLFDSSIEKMNLLNNDSLQSIVNDVKNWYAHQSVTTG